MAENILTVENLNIAYQGVPAVMDVNFTLERGKVLTIVGESGSGKTTVIRALMGLLPVDGEVTDGTMIFNGHNLRTLSKSEWRAIRGKDMAMIFQDSGSALDPIVRIGKQFRELFKSHIEITNDECDRRAIELLESVSLPNGADILRRYPHELSGGMRQRVMIAMAMSCKPSVLIADEPTTALDVTIQAQILDLIKGLQAEMHAGIILITHDLGVVAEMADRVAVLYAGEVVEIGTAEQIFKNPKHPYTRSLLRSIPQLDDENSSDDLYVIQGMVPSLKTLDRQGCRFADRIPWVKDEGHEHNPTLHEVEEGHHVRCTCYKNFEFEGEENNA